MRTGTCTGSQCSKEISETETCNTEPCPDSKYCSLWRQGRDFTIVVSFTWNPCMKKAIRSPALAQPTCNEWTFPFG